jgi:predicted dehydrogenase
VCDLVPERVARAQAAVEKAGQKRPAGFHAGETDFENLCRREDLDVVYIATPWRWHVPMAVAAMEAGKHAFVEVPAASTIEECWRLVDASERTRRHCVMLENCCYGYNELMVLNMVRAGLLGELTHAEAAYIHDLREVLFDDHEGLWRRDEHFTRNGNLYPTHGLGPVAQYLDVNRGDRFEALVSMSSLERSLSLRRDRLPAGDPRRKETYACGDMNTSIIRTARGRTVLLQHDVVTPRPYDRINHVSGTKGSFRDYPPRIFLDGQKDDRWGSIKPYRKRFEHPLWTRLRKLASKGGHGGMDYVMSWRLMQCVREGLVPDMDVYDAATWSAPAPLSEQSVKGGGSAVAFPDFTRGRWQAVRVQAGMPPAAVMGA